MSIISPNFDVKSIFFPNFGQGPFPKIAGKGPVRVLSDLLNQAFVHLCKKRSKFYVESFCDIKCSSEHFHIIINQGKATYC